MTKKLTNRMAKTVAGESGYDRDIDLATLASLMNTERTQVSELADHPRDPPQPADQHVVAYFAANPRGTHPLGLGEECAEIQRELKLAPFRGDFHFESRWAVTGGELFRHLNEVDPVVAHFGGHGSNRGLILQDDHGGPELVSPRAFAMLIRSAARSARVVVLNACSTMAHAQALRGAVDVIVAMTGAIGDDAARIFAARFYGALANRRSVGNAVEQGVAMLAVKNLPDEVLPRFVTRDGVDAYDVFLPALERRGAR
jgi:hypothetical protein